MRQIESETTFISEGYIPLSVDRTELSKYIFTLRRIIKIFQKNAYIGKHLFAAFEESACVANSKKSWATLQNLSIYL